MKKIVVVKDLNKTNVRKTYLDESRLESFILRGLEKNDVNEKTKAEYISKMKRVISSFDEIESKNISDMLIKEALVLTNDIKNEDGFVTPEFLKNTGWNSFASFVLLQQLYKRASRNRSYQTENNYGDFLGLVNTLTEKGLYTKDLLEQYSDGEIQLLGSEIVAERDLLFDFAGLHSLSKRYLVTDYDGSLYELPQERFMVIAMHLMMLEEENRIEKTIELYWALSNLYLTVATPTMTNAGRVTGGLSSCFVLTTEDSLRSIYDDNTDVATFSKNGAGIGKLPA